MTVSPYTIDDADGARLSAVASFCAPVSCRKTVAAP
jgi:hypothetical protein